VNPFTGLGLSAAAALTDAQVRDAWRAAAAATHPDRGDGGDPAAYAAAAAAYEQLRTAWGRTEALADLTACEPPGSAPSGSAVVRGPGLAAWNAVLLLPARVWHGRPGRLAVRTVIAAAAAALGMSAVSGTASAPAIAVGCLLWWALTARSDLAPPPGR
jgi:hypothetical protein